MRMINNIDTEELYQAFKVFDKDGDGQITTNELGTVMRSVGMNPSDDELAEMLGVLDEDGNGKIDFQEFMTIMAKKTKDADYDVRLREAFNVFDKDGTGCMSASDFRHMMTNLGEKLPDEEVDEIIQEVGLTPDSKIRCEDFVRLMLSK